jgi:hypothetical protein
LVWLCRQVARKVIIQTTEGGRGDGVGMVNRKTTISGAAVLFFVTRAMELGKNVAF